MFVKPSKNTPAAIRKARWEAEQAAKHQQVLNSVKPKVSLAKTPKA